MNLSYHLIPLTQPGELTQPRQFSFLSRPDGATVRPPAASLTGAAEALLPQADQHVEAQVAVGRLVEVLQPPHVLPVVLHVLQVGEGGKHITTLTV